MFGVTWLQIETSPRDLFLCPSYLQWIYTRHLYISKTCIYIVCRIDESMLRFVAQWVRWLTSLMSKYHPMSVGTSCVHLDPLFAMHWGQMIYIQAATGALCVDHWLIHGPDGTRMQETSILVDIISSRPRTGIRCKQTSYKSENMPQPQSCSHSDDWSASCTHSSTPSVSPRN